MLGSFSVWTLHRSPVGRAASLYLRQSIGKVHPLSLSTQELEETPKHNPADMRGTWGSALFPQLHSLGTTDAPLPPPFSAGEHRKHLHALGRGSELLSMDGLFCNHHPHAWHKMGLWGAVPLPGEHTVFGDNVWACSALPPARTQQWGHPSEQKAIPSSELLPEVHAWSKEKQKSDLLGA